MAETAGQVVTYQGRPVVTYFFSTSGGRTENVENSLGGTPQPWLRSVEDPYDDASPRHRWSRCEMTPRRGRPRSSAASSRAPSAGSRSSSAARSPRVVAADVVGTRGQTRVTGATLRARFGLYDTWAYFTSIASRRPRRPSRRRPTSRRSARPGEGTGGVTPSARMTRFPTIASAGRHRAARPRRRARASPGAPRRALAHALLTVRVRRGAYRAAVTQPGAYRAVFRGDAGRAVRVR